MDDAPAKLSAIVCTHNPRSEHIEATLASLARQVHVPEGAEFLLIDNASDDPLTPRINLGALTNFASARIIREEKLGLTHARLRAFHEASGDILLFIDDDNVLASDYVHSACDAMTSDPTLAAAGGKSIPHYETEPPEWFTGLGISLACRDLGDQPQFSDWAAGERFYPDCAPIGAGMVVRRAACEAWVSAVTENGTRISLGRRGSDLASGEDNDLMLTLLGQGWRVAYLPQLSLVHLIPARRLSLAYLERYVESGNQTWVRVLDVHGIRPWSAIPRWTVPLRRLKLWLKLQPWRGPVERIRWRGAIGLILGRADLQQN